jgi:outer membrane protein OmpA-like peptidoglycan-associated protein
MLAEKLFSLVRRWIRPSIFLSLSMVVFACAPSAPPTAQPSKSFFVFFASDSTELTPEALTVLDLVAEEARQIKATGVGIMGYSSTPGTQSDNLRLSDARSAAVEAALLARNIPRDIVFRSPQGAIETIGPTVEGRRVEIVVSREIRR